MTRKKHTIGGSFSLESFSQAVERMSRQREQETQEYIRQFRAKMPEAAKDLPEKSGEELLQYYLEFTAGRADPRVTEVHQEFADIVRAEILRRMGETP